MASIQPYKDGYRAQIDMTVNGVRKRDSGTFRTKREASAWASAREHDLRENATIEPSERYTLADALNQYARLVSSGKRGEKWERNRIASFIGDFPEYASKRLADMGTAQWAEWRDRRLAGYVAPDGERVRPVTGGSILRELNLYSAVYTVARKEWGWIDKSPITDMGRPRDNPPRDRLPHPLKEVRPIVRWLGYRANTEPASKSAEVALAFMVALRTGMRAKELRGLGKGTLDLSRRVARVDHKMQYMTGKPREIPLTRHAIRLLKPVAGRERCFSVSAESLDALFRKAKDALGIDGLHFHDSRADALTRLSRKVDVMTLSRISGVKDLRILNAHYYRESASDIAARLASDV